MVKNERGGNSSKKFARKSFNTHYSGLRLSTDSMELYAYIVKPLGNGMFFVNTITGLTNLLLHVRGKFSKKSKGNFITTGSFVLVGLREFESTPKNCDLLEIYSDIDVQNLMTYPNISYFFQSYLNGTNATNNSTINSDDIIFSNNASSFNETDDNENILTTIKEDLIDFDEI